MSDPIITVENLGKKYSLRHQRGERYTALRDVLADKARNLFRRNGNDSDITREDFWALKDVCFEVKQGEVVGIIGRNGAGKSTLLKILSRITEPTEGRIRIKGRVASLLEVGTGFHPELTGRENIFLNGAILGMVRAEIKTKFGEIVAFAEIEKFLDTPVKRYSSGMYVRLAFAVAAHLEPEILIVDEVLAVGDSEFQKRCLGKMHEVSRGGRTVIFVSHNMGAVSKLCGQAIWLEHGRMADRGETSNVIARYLTSRTHRGAACDWPGGISNDGVKEFKLLAARIVNEDSTCTEIVDGSKPFAIEMHYVLHTPVPYLRVGFALSAIDGTVIFESYDCEQQEFAGKRQPGESLLICEIPGNLLAPGRYLISLNAGMPGIKNFVNLPNLLSLEIEDTSEGAWLLLGDREGIIRPKLNWTQHQR